MQDGISKIKELLKTGKVVNVNLAYELAKGLDIDLNALILEEYQDLLLISRCINQEKVQDQLITLFSKTSLDIGYMYIDELPDSI
ncbi:MAG: hypothetical protein MK212_06250, partial [Saprospiraceae bacterium]|nr:hypothetical protein [Saprospiraceae bacterium]